MKYSKNNIVDKDFVDIPDEEFQKIRDNLGKKVKNETTSPKKKKKTK